MRKREQFWSQDVTHSRLQSPWFLVVTVVNKAEWVWGREWDITFFKSSPNPSPPHAYDDSSVTLYGNLAHK